MQKHCTVLEAFFGKLHYLFLDIQFTSLMKVCYFFTIYCNKIYLQNVKDRSRMAKFVLVLLNPVWAGFVSYSIAIFLKNVHIHILLRLLFSKVLRKFTKSS
jgi:hypothetical protein